MGTLFLPKNEGAFLNKAHCGIVHISEYYEAEESARRGSQ
jgi:hypothetical protein